VPDCEQKAKSFGVLLVNLGTPDAPTTSAVRRYLREFLSDPRVIETPKWIWWFILNCIILQLRPRKVAKLYQSIWMDGGSPLLVYSQRIRAALERELANKIGPAVPVALAMTYGSPSVQKALAEFQEQGIERILVLPLYPQYSATTTGAIFDVLARAINGERNIPELRFIKEYSNNTLYIKSLAGKIKAFWSKNDLPEKLLMSFHGIPQSYADKGDPYPQQCIATANALANELELSPEQWVYTFQSRFGPTAWLQPYTDKTLEQWGREGLKRVDVISPAFAADCLETLEEMQIQNRELYIEAGGGEYNYIPALNDDPAFISTLTNLVDENTQGW